MDDYTYSPVNPVLASGETILWRGKPKRSAFILSKVLTMMPIALLWLCFDGFFIGSMLHSGSGMWFMIPFFALHLMPVWIWLGSALTASRRWTNTDYYVTNRRIIIRGGFLAVNETSLFYKDLRNAQVRIGLLDNLTHTGDILFDDGTVSYNRNRRTVHMLEDLEDPHGVYSRIQKIILDMQTDMEFPNAYRPEENPGYRTQYRP